MKKFISMAMAAIMIIGTAPLSIFAADEEIAKIKTVGAIEWNVEEAKEEKNLDAVELQISLKDFSHSFNNKNEVFELELDFDGAYITTYNPDQFDMNKYTLSGVYRDGVRVDGPKIYLNAHEEKDTVLEFEVHENGFDFHKDDKIILVAKDLRMDKYSKGAKAVVDVTGDFGEATDLPVAAIYGNGFKVNYSKKLTEIAVENEKVLDTITIKSKVGTFSNKEEIKVKINSDFEISKFEATMIEGGIYKDDSLKDNREFVIIPFDGSKEITIKGLEIESLDDAKPGDVAKFEIKCNGYDTAHIEVAKVIKDEVIISVDKDEDIPVMYSGTDSNNTGLDTYQSHEALTVTIEETVVNAWDLRGGWTLELPKGVYVTDKSEFTCENIVGVTDPTELFAEAYEDGKFKAFDFDRDSFEIADDEKAKFEFTLDLIAEPGFEGKVELVFKTRNAEQKVVIAEFVKPYIVEADQNKINSEYRTVVLDKNIVIKETEEELWSEGTEFAFDLERITFNKDTKVTGTNVKVDTDIDKYVLTIEVDEPSDDEKAEITVSNITLNMDRNNLPLGDYELTLNTTMSNKFMSEDIFGTNEVVAEVYYDDNELFNELVRKDFVSVVDEDELKIVVPIGSTQIYSNEKVINLDVPAYINEAGYTMLPIRAVANACGISDGQVVWNDETKTVTIFYNNRIVSMSLGEQAMHINGVVVPTASKLEIVNGRSFIPMRDLALALGISEINWDPVNRVATLG